MFDRPRPAECPDARIGGHRFAAEGGAPDPTVSRTHRAGAQQCRGRSPSAQGAENTGRELQKCGIPFRRRSPRNVSSSGESCSDCFCGVLGDAVEDPIASAGTPWVESRQADGGRSRRPKAPAARPLRRMPRQGRPCRFDGQIVELLTHNGSSGTGRETLDFSAQRLGSASAAAGGAVRSSLGARGTGLTEEVQPIVAGDRTQGRAVAARAGESIG